MPYDVIPYAIAREGKSETHYFPTGFITSAGVIHNSSAWLMAATCFSLVPPFIWRSKVENRSNGAVAIATPANLQHLTEGGNSSSGSQEPKKKTHKKQDFVVLCIKNKSTCGTIGVTIRREMRRWKDKRGRGRQREMRRMRRHSRLHSPERQSVSFWS